MKQQRKSQIVHVFFNLSVIGKGIDGALEILGGVLLLFISPDRIHSIIRVLSQHELSEDHRDMIATYLLNSSDQLTSGVTMFAAAYLLWHGMVKVGLVAALLLKRRWAYPAAIIAFFLFVIYQLYRYSHTHSPALLVLSIVDMLVITLTWIEYKRLKTVRGFARPPKSTE